MNNKIVRELENEILSRTINKNKNKSYIYKLDPCLISKVDMDLYTLIYILELYTKSKLNNKKFIKYYVRELCKINVLNVSKSVGYDMLLLCKNDLVLNNCLNKKIINKYIDHYDRFIHFTSFFDILIANLQKVNNLNNKKYTDYTMSKLKKVLNDYDNGKADKPEVEFIIMDECINLEFIDFDYLSSIEGTRTLIKFVINAKL